MLRYVCLLCSSPEAYKWLKDATRVRVSVAGGENIDVSILRLPVTYRLSPFVVPRDKLTLLQLENGLVTVPENLPDACKSLYANVAGENITLNDSNFPDFTSAIELSCKDGWCYRELQKKKAALETKRNARWNEPGSEEVSDEDKRKIAEEEDKMTYIRVTLGYDHVRGQPKILTCLSDIDGSRVTHRVFHMSWRSGLAATSPLSTNTATPVPSLRLICPSLIIENRSFGLF
jgi:hypothetical protein